MKMPWKTMAGMLVLGLSMTVLGTGCDQGAAEKSGEKVDKAATDLNRAVKDENAKIDDKAKADLKVDEAANKVAADKQRLDDEAAKAKANIDAKKDDAQKTAEDTAKKPGT